MAGITGNIYWNFIAVTLDLHKVTYYIDVTFLIQMPWAVVNLSESVACYRKRITSAKPYHGVRYPNSVISTFLRELSA